MNESDIPIDIHYNKLSDWLVNRRHCPQQWQGAALEIREKINPAIQDMPPVEDITKLLHGTYINYFHCLKIVELLKGTEDGSKNIFGRYSSQRMKDWKEIIRLYENDGTCLGESAQMLARNVNYEIPALKKQIARCQQAQNDCLRKETEYASNAKELEEKYHTSCKNMGIKGKKVKSELLELVKDMPATYERIVASASELHPGGEYYSAFVDFMLATKTSSIPVETLPMLKHILNKGNTTTYEWRHGTVPASVEEVNLEYREDSEDQDVDAQTAEIDWGDFDAEADGIDFGIEDATQITAEGTGTADGIAWDDGSAPSVDIQIVDDSLTDIQSSQDKGVARGSDALTVLDNTETRNMLINELLELQAFLSQRLQEMSDDNNILSSSQFHTAPRVIQIDAKDVQSMLGKVTEVVDNMTSKKMQDLFLIRSSPRYVDRMAESLKKILRDSEKTMSLSRLMVVRHQEAVDEDKETLPKLDLIRRRTKELQSQVEKEISKKYKGRRVNIMGEINTV